MSARVFVDTLNANRHRSAIESPEISLFFCSMYCTDSSLWGQFGRNTRSAFRRTSSQRTPKLKKVLYFVWVLAYVEKK